MLDTFARFPADLRKHYQIAESGMGFQPISEVTDVLNARSKKCIASGNAMIKVGEALYMSGQQRTDKVPDLLPPPASSQQRDVEHPIDIYVQVDMDRIPDQTAECLFDDGLPAN